MINDNSGYLGHICISLQRQDVTWKTFQNKLCIHYPSNLFLLNYFFDRLRYWYAIPVIIFIIILISDMSYTLLLPTSLFNKGACAILLFWLLLLLCEILLAQHRYYHLANNIYPLFYYYYYIIIYCYFSYIIYTTKNKMNKILHLFN